MNANSYVLAPVCLMSSNVLLSGEYLSRLPDGAEVLNNLDRAMVLENDQKLPPGYRIWRDIQDCAEANFRSTNAYREAMLVIDPIATAFWQAHMARRIGLQKNKIRGTISLFEDFVYTVAYDIAEQLKTVSASRFRRSSPTATKLSRTSLRWASNRLA